MTEPRAILLNAAFAYTARGFRVVPVPERKKGPIHDGWQNLRLGFDDLHHHFNGSPGNLGILLGEPSGDLVDVDLDCPEAVELADEFLPPTHVVTGRPSAPRSHRWYLASGVNTKKHRDAVTRKMIVEVRSTGAQTLVGPSVHPSGEAYDHLDGIPPTVDGDELVAQVAALAAAVERRRYPDGVPQPQRGPTSAATAPPVRTSAIHDDERVLRRAEAYLDAMPPAISGSGGHSATYAAATALVHGFALAPDVALDLLRGRFNPRCEPPWSNRELEHKINDAASKPHDRPHGWLRDTVPAETSDVDLSHFAVADDASDDDACESDKPSDPGMIPEHFYEVPGFIADVVAHNRATAPRWQPTLALAGAICLQSVLAARKVMDERGNRTNIYAVCLASSGSGKEIARTINQRTLHLAGLEDLDGQGDLASDAGLVSAVEINPAILFQIDEFGRWLRTIGDPKKAPHLFNVISTLMKLYSAAGSIYKGKAYADPKRNKTIDQPCISLFATTAPDHFREALTQEAMSDGFMARLFVFETVSMPKREWRPVLDPPASVLEAARWWGKFAPGGNLRATHPEPAVVPTTAEARAVFDALAIRGEEEMQRPREDVRAVWARVEEKACRLALIYACSRDRQQPVIDAAAAEWACALSEHLTKRMLFLAHEYVARNEFDSQQKAVLRAMKAAGGRMTRSELCNATGHLTQRVRAEVVENLKETGRIIESIEKTPGRTRRIYELVP